MTDSMETLPVVVIGAGPIGLAAAARLVEDSLPFVVIEARPQPGGSVSLWGHVRLFTPWRYLVDEAAHGLLSTTGWQSPPEDSVPFGRDLVESYLKPLAAHPAIAPFLRLSTRVTGVTRLGADKLSSTRRTHRPFEVRIRNAAGAEEVILGRAIIDASGTHDSPNPIGSGGIPALGELQAADLIHYGIPDVQGRDLADFAGRSVGVVGSGHSAFNALLDFASLPATDRPELSWFVRSPSMGAMFGGEDADALSERGALGRRMRELAESGAVRVWTDFRTRHVHRAGDQIILESDTGRRSEPVHRIVGVTGFRPDYSILSELRLDLDSTVEAPTALAPLIDPNLHSCGTVPPHGRRQLAHPENGLFVVGMKSYGRAPTFLMLTGYEQVRSVVKFLAGDLLTADDVKLQLPETGVCSTDLPLVDREPVDAAAEGCCGSPTPLQRASSPVGSQ